MYNLFLGEIFKSAEEEMLNMNHSYVRLEHLFLSLLKKSKKIINLCNKYKLTYSLFKNEVLNTIGTGLVKPEIVVYDPLLKKVVYAALEDAIKDKCKLNEMYLLKSIVNEEDVTIFNILTHLNIDVDNLCEEININIADKKKKLLIFDLGNNLNEEVSLQEKVIGREKEINILIETLLRKNKNNPLLIGEAGVGKTALVEELARRIKLHNVPSELDDKIIVNLELGSLLSGTKYRGEFEEKFIKIIKELENNPNLILFIDEIHGIINAGGADGAINAADILKPYLARGKIKVIGATTFNEYNKWLLKDKALVRRFEVIKLLEPNQCETIDILTKIKDSYENHYHIKITKKNITDIVNLSSKYILNRQNPDKSLDVLDSLCANIVLKHNDYNIKNKLFFLQNEKEKMIKCGNYNLAYTIEEQIISLKNKLNDNLKITKNDILNFICHRYGLPLVCHKDKTLDKLKNMLIKNIPNEDSIICEIINTLKIGKKSGPLSILLVGPNNIGQNKIVKGIANILKMPLLELDMSEYINPMMVSKLIGSPVGYGDDDINILNNINLNPNSIILLNNIDKCCDEVRNLFFHIFKNGFIVNSKGVKLNFANSLIFMTGDMLVNNKIGFDKKVVKSKNDILDDFVLKVDKIIKYKKVNTKEAIKI